HGTQDAHQRIRGPALALNAADSCGTTADIDFGIRVSIAEYLVEIAYRADIRISGIGTPYARRIGHHRLQLLTDYRLEIRQQNRVPIRLGHLAAIRAWKFRGLGLQRLRLRKNLLAPQLVKLIEPSGDLPRQFDVR